MKQQRPSYLDVFKAHRQGINLCPHEGVNYLTSGEKASPEERGIVIAGGGLKYFPSVWVNVHLVRHFGCKLPIQLWHLGKGEIDPYLAGS